MSNVRGVAKRILRPLWRKLVVLGCVAGYLFTRLRFAGRAVTIGTGSWCSFRSSIQVRAGGRISIGNHCEIHPYSMLITYGGEIRIGDRCSVNPFTMLYGHGGLIIGNGVRIAAHVVVVSANHVPASAAVPLHASGFTREGIVIEDDVWVGAGVQILDGVTIGRGAIVGAGSVVTRSVPPGAKVAGVPAREIGHK